jgi:hypothetical protein
VPDDGDWDGVRVGAAPVDDDADDDSDRAGDTEGSAELTEAPGECVRPTRAEAEAVQPVTGTAPRTAS